MAGLQRQARVLLDQQDRDAFAGDGAHHLEDLLDHQRRQAHRRLVQQQQLGARDHRAAHRHHLLLAAGQGARRLLAAFGQAREQREDAVGVLADLRGIAADMPRPSGTMTRPLRTSSCDFWPPIDWPP
ncbi:hypothetical protein G6F68_017765 [Rhizopus microsporus]|nr:hypothetical protein G6F68_017765 [Rhizopus microsporus]